MQSNSSSFPSLVKIVCQVSLLYFYLIFLLLLPLVVGLTQVIAYQVESPLLPREELKAATDQTYQVLLSGRVGETEFTQAEVSHLLDVRRVLIGGLVVSFLAEVGWWLTRRVQISTQSWRNVFIIFSVCSIFGLFFFSYSFELFHRTFFPQGNYSFNYNSLIIQTFPPFFWSLNFGLLQGGVVALLGWFWWRTRTRDFF